MQGSLVLLVQLDPEGSSDLWYALLTLADPNDEAHRWEAIRIPNLLQCIVVHKAIDTHQCARGNASAHFSVLLILR